jgi:anti-sigma regulatory factor (Ser/Thr protein kinase)
LEDLSLHILDVAENAVRAKAHCVWIRVRENLDTDLLEIEIEDDGQGMEPEMAEQVLDPFVTTRKTRRIGLGLPLLADAARMTGGEVQVSSEPGKGTLVRASFQHGHIDRKPLGDMGSTLVSLLLANPDADYIYEHRRDKRSFCLDTREIRRELAPVPLDRPEVLNWVREQVREGLRQVVSTET